MEVKNLEVWNICKVFKNLGGAWKSCGRGGRGGAAVCFISKEISIGDSDGDNNSDVTVQLGSVHDGNIISFENFLMILMISHLLLEWCSVN